MSYCDIGEHLFILGSARSGTSLMSSIVQSSPDFSSYRAETKLLNSCQAVYGDLNNAKSRARFWSDWFHSRQFIRSGLTEQEVRRTTGFLRSYIAILGTYMNMIAEQQNCKRWVDSTPSNVNCLKEISIAFPKAKIIHMVRDGRAVALSLAKLGWSGGRTANFDKALLYSALKWQRAVTVTHSSKCHFDDRFLEISYEALIHTPDEVLQQVSDFLHIPLLDSRSLASGVANGSEDVNSTLQIPNSPFGDMTSGLSSNAIYRWKTMLTYNQIEIIEACVGTTLRELGYTRQSDACLSSSELFLLKWRNLGFKLKRILKHQTVLGRFSISPLEIEQD